MSLAADPRMEQGARFEAQGNFEMALGEYRAILAENPKSSEAYFAAAEVRMKMKDYSGALANYRLAYKFNPEMSAAYEGAAKVYEALGQKGKANDERAKDPKNNPAPVPATEVAPAVPAAPAAVAETPAAPKAEPAPAAPAPVAEAPKSEPAKTEPAKVVDAPKSEPAKVAEAPKAEPAKTEPAKTELAKTEPAKVAEAPKSEPAAAPAKTEATALPSDPFEKGKVLFAEGNYKEAASAWREVLKKTPGHAGAYFYAGLTRYELGEYEKAEFNLKKGLEYKDGGNDANYFLAMIAQKGKKQDQEQKFLNAYLKKAAPGAKYRKQAEERIAELKTAKAEAAAEPVVEVKAEAAEAKAAAKDAKTTETATVAAVAPAPEAAPTEANMADRPSELPTLANANLLFSAGSFETALQMYKALLETEQNPEERYFTMLQMGNIYREMRDFHSAVTRYREVVQQFPDSDWATEAERALEDAVWLEKHAKELPSRKR